MPHLIGNDLESGIVRPTLPRKPSLPGKPVGLRARPTLEDVDPDMADRLRYTQSVYGGDAAQTYQSHRAAIDSQFDYTMQRARSGKKLLPVADPHWRPDRYTDATNEDWAQWYQKQSEQPSPPEQTDPTAADHVELMRQYRQQRAADESALPRGLPTNKAQSDTQAPPSEPFDWMGLANNPYKELAKLLPQGPLRSVTNGVGTGFQYLPSTLVRDYVMPVPGMLVKNAVKAVDDAAEGKPLSFDPGVSAYELFGRSAQAARRTGQTEIADGLEFLLNDPVGKVILSALGEMALDPLTYISGVGLAKGAKALQALKAEKAAEAADISTDILRAEKTAQAMDTPPMQGTAVTEKPPLAKALEVEIQKAQSMGDVNPPAVADEVPKGYTGEAGAIGKYSQTIKWGIQDVEVRPAGKGFFGQRTKQINPRVDAYEQKINPNNESYYLESPSGGYVQYENMANDVVMDGKLVINQKSFYHVYDLPEFAKNKVLQEATRQVDAANSVGYSVEWLVSDPNAAEQLTDFFKIKNIKIVVMYFPE